MTHHRKKRHHHDSPEVHAVPAHTEQKPEPKKIITEKKPEAKKEISWKAAEFHYIEKDLLWHTSIVLAGVLLLIFSYAQKNLFFAIFVIIATVLVMEFGRRRPRVLEYAVNEEGFLINKSLYLPYRKLESFRIHKRQGMLDEIVFKKHSRANPFLYIPADEATALAVQEFLLHYLPEDEHDESFAEIIAERIGF